MFFSVDLIRKLYRIGLYGVIILILLDLLFFFYYPDTPFSQIFIATKEQTPLTWLSALAMFMLSLSCFSVYWRKKNFSWYALAVIFFFFSMDDAVYFHERISGTAQSSLSLFSGFPTYVWVVLYFPLLLFALVALLYFLWRNSPRTLQKMLVLAVILLISAIGLDLVDGLVQKNDHIVFCVSDLCDRNFSHVIRLIEEVAEVIAIGLLGYINIVKYCIFTVDKHCRQKESSSL